MKISVPNILVPDPSHIVCTLCDRRFVTAMNFEGCRQGWCCAVFVDGNGPGLAGDYGSCAFDNDRMPFIDGVIPPGLLHDDVICDYCVARAIERGLVSDASLDGNWSLNPNKCGERLKRERVAGDLCQDVIGNHPFPSAALSCMARSLVITTLWVRLVGSRRDRPDRGIFMSFLLDDGLLYTFDGAEAECVDANFRGKECPTDVVQFLRDYPFWAKYTALDTEKTNT